MASRCSCLPGSGRAAALSSLRAGRLSGPCHGADPQAVGTTIHLERVYETDMAEGLKAMALEGHGAAFLPYSAVKASCARTSW